MRVFLCLRITSCHAQNIDFVDAVWQTLAVGLQVLVKNRKKDQAYRLINTAYF